MIYILLSLLLLVIILLTIGLIRYHLALVNLSQQIEDKIRTESMKRIGVSTFSKDFLHLYQQINHLFQEVEQSRLIMKREKQTLDMAISNIAHDIRTPLTIASGYTQQLLKDADKDQMDQQLQKIADNLSMVSRRLEALMEYRRLMEGAIRPKLQRVDLSQLVTQQLFAYYDAFQQAGIDLDVALSENLLLETDSDIFDRIVQNMLSNVLKHGRETASISLKKEGQKVIFQVKNKVQKPILHLDKLTNRFYSENLSSSEESSGLGLYITQQLVEILGGDLTIQVEDDWFELIVAL